MPVLHKHPRKRNNKSSNYKKNSYMKIIRALLKIKKLGTGNVTFYYRDGSIKSMPFSTNLFTDERGNERRFGDIISILNDLKHDFRAIRYRIS